jgi:hypothetical protein
MCSLARIQSRVVSGFGRGLNFSVFDPQTGPFKNNHAWNAVQIDGGWYLVDATWDAGHIDGATDSFAWHYSRSFLFTPPEIFLCTHLPEDPRWQLQPRPIGEAQFGALPFLEGEFGKMGFSATGLALVTQVKGTCKFSIGLPAGWELTSYVYAADKTTTNPTQKVQTRKVGDAMEFEVPFPSAGRYGLSLAARPAGSSANSIYVGSLYFIAVK